MSHSLASDISAAAARVDPEAPSTSKWNPIRDLIAEALPVPYDHVYAITVSKPGNLKVRAEQSPAARGAKILVAMCNVSSGTDLMGTIRSAEVRVKEGRSLVLVCDEASGWVIVAVVKAASAPIPAALATAYPTASVVDV